MKKIVIIADSTCDLTPEYVKENDVQILPITLWPTEYAIIHAIDKAQERRIP